MSSLLSPTSDQLEILKRMAAKDHRYCKAAGVPIPPSAIKKPLPYSLPVARIPCQWEGAITESCPNCNKVAGEAKHVRQCGHPTVDRDTCTREYVSHKVQACSTCHDYAPSSPEWNNGVLRIHHNNFYPETGGHRFNASIIEWRDGYTFCWRDGWKGSNLWLCQMDRKFQPVGHPKKLDIHHVDANYGREDPQLFLFRDSLFVAFVGVQGHGNRVQKTNVLYASLDNEFRVTGVYAPKAPGVPYHRWEKNWQFFDYANELYAIYSVTPHKVLHIDGDYAEWCYESHTLSNWSGGEIRGGSSPYRIGDRFISFFHDKIDGPRGKLLYRAGAYTFEAKPPFRVLAMTPKPLLVADPSTNPGNYCDCIFPRGAVQVEDGWILSCGVHDRFNEVHRIPKTVVESELIPTSANPSVIESLPGWCSFEKSKVMAEAVAEIKPFVCVEIGVFGGRSLMAMAMALKKLGSGVVYGIDPWENNQAEYGLEGEELNWWHGQNLTDIYKTCCETITQLELWPHVRILCAPSQKISNIFSVIDLLHIDGNHCQDSALRDVTNYLPYVRSGGLVFMDDVDWPSVQLAVCAIKSECDLVRDETKWHLYKKR